MSLSVLKSTLTHILLLGCASQVTELGARAQTERRVRQRHEAGAGRKSRCFAETAD